MHGTGHSMPELSGALKFNSAVAHYPDSGSYCILHVFLYHFSFVILAVSIADCSIKYALIYKAIPID